MAISQRAVWGNYYLEPYEQGTILGNYQDRLRVIHAAEDYCHKWYIAERGKPLNMASLGTFRQIAWGT
jgi:hypothetical protein